MAKKDGIGCVWYLIIFLIVLFFSYPIQSIILISVGIFIYWYIETNYKRIKREEYEKSKKGRERRWKENERREKVRREERENMERSREKERFEDGFRENMSGDEYEKYCKYILEQRGWEVNITPKSGDQGVDLIASKEYLKVCIQCKRYSKPVGNKAV